MSRPAPMDRQAPQRERAEVAIHGIDHRGAGIARRGDRQLRVEGVLAGERVLVDIVRRRRRFDDARLVAVLEPSPDRAAPGCPHFHVCGGCRYQHQTPAAQRRAHEQALSAALERHGVTPPAARLAPLTGPAYAYRRKARLAVKHVPGKGGALVGFREKRGGFVAEIDACRVLVPAAGERIDALRALVSALEARDRIPQIELAAGDAQTALVFRHLGPLSDGDREALAAFAGTHGLSVYLQSGGPETIAPLMPQDPPPLRYRLPEFALELDFEPAHFVQVNAVVNRKLVALAYALLEPDAGDRLLDLFCGIGNFSLALARAGGEVQGVEASDAMVTAATRNAALNGIRNARFGVADLDDPAQAGAVLGGAFSKLLLDPPRSGAAAVTAALKLPYPSRIVYVSCNPESFARDAAVLTRSHDYRLARAGLVDMFPHTGHVEVIGQFLKA